MPIVEAFQLANSHSLIALALLVPKKLEKNWLKIYLII
jgi:hypothetical protein